MLVASTAALTTDLLERPMAEKQCTKCGIVKPLTEFYTQGRNRKGHCAACKICTTAYVRAHWSRTNDSRRAYQRAYREKHKEKIAMQARRLRIKNAGRSAEYTKRCRENNPAKAILAAAKARAKKYGIPFSITVADIVIPDKCPILGIAFGPNTRRGVGSHWDSMSLDRTIPKIGYISGNVEVMSRLANTMKSNATREHLLAFADWIYRKFGRASPLAAPLRGIASNATHCPACRMSREIAQEALDRYAQDC